MDKATQGSETGASKTVAEFCRAESLSKTSYYQLQRRGLGPDELRPPGTKIIRVTAAAHAAWRERMAELSRSKAAELEVERRREQATIAGRAAAQSPRHVSRHRKVADRPHRR
jgi:hypothetical protein